MTLYRCCEDWEYNGRDDSDWYCVTYNSETGEFVRVETGTTRFANGLRVNTGIVPMTQEFEAAAMAALVKRYAGMVRHKDECEVNEPSIDTLQRGVNVRFIEHHHCMQKDKAEEVVDCKKCGGSGQWTNPYRSSDKRECFACGGSGKAKKTTRTRAKGEDGKPVWIEIEVGSVGVVMGQATFGTFYRNGYNRPGRSNTTVYVKLADGREVQTPASKLGLTRSVMTDEQVQKEAERLADRIGFYGPFATASISML